MMAVLGENIMKKARRTIIFLLSFTLAAACLAPACEPVSALDGEEQNSGQTQDPTAPTTEPTQPADPFAGARGWVTDSEGRTYYVRDGKPLKGVRKIKNTWYRFNRNTGALIRKIGDDMDKKAQKYTSRKKYLILVSYSKHRVRVYKGKKNNWTREKNFKCSLGKGSSPTPKGTFKITSKGKYFNSASNGRCWYWSGFVGNTYLFHSVIYHRTRKPTRVKDGRLGKNISHGCIRLHISSAKWIYDNVPRNSKVIVY